MSPIRITPSRVATLMLAVYWIALATSTHVPKLPTISVRHGDKLAHYVAYAILALLLSWAWTTRRPYFPRGVFFVLAVAIAYGAIDELTQIPVPGRSGEWYDFLADTLGAVTGICMFWTLDTLRLALRARKARRLSTSVAAANPEAYPDGQE